MHQPPDRARRLHPETSSVSEGFDPELSVMAVRPPIYPVSTYAFRSAEEMSHWFRVALGREQALPGEHASLIYARLNHPNAEMFEDALRAVEKGCAGAAAFSSGMSAITTALLTFLRPGDVMVFGRPVYGGTHELLQHILPQWNVEVRSAPGDDLQQIRAAVEAAGERLAVLYLETPANPTLRMLDLSRTSALLDGLRAARPERKPVVVVDNTFLGPVFQSPLLHGADVVVYSATKFLGGHSDLVAGAVTVREAELIARVKATRAFLGTICEPFTAWMLQRSMATLYLRMIKQSKNASKIVDVLKAHPAVESVHYPTLFTGEQARIFASQCSAPGSLIALELKGGRNAAFRFLNALRIVRLAVSLGGVESLACHPRTTTASEMEEGELQRCGIVDGLVRLSIGVEYWRDVAADLSRALDAAASGGRPAGT